MKSFIQIALIAALGMTLVAPAHANEKEPARRKNSKAASDKEQLAEDYRLRREKGDTADQHGYQPCRDGGRCGYYYRWGYGRYHSGFHGYGRGAGGWRSGSLPRAGYSR